MGNCHPEKTNVDRGEAVLVANHFMETSSPGFFFTEWAKENCLDILNTSI